MVNQSRGGASDVIGRKGRRYVREDHVDRMFRALLPFAVLADDIGAAARRRDEIFGQFTIGDLLDARLACDAMKALK